jgi:hypothetical protein
MKHLLEQLEAAVLRRNPGYSEGLQPPLPPEHIRPALKRVGLKENVDLLIEWYGWHDGTRFRRECDASRLGLAPPVISAPDAKNVAFLESLGHKLNLPQKIYDTIAFFNFEAGLRTVKLWRKFSATNPFYAVLVGRFFPILIRTLAANEIAVDVSAGSGGRVVMITHDGQVRGAYSSIEEFLRDLIRANDTNELLACVKTPGAVLQLEPIVQAKKPKARAGSNAPTLPASDKAPLVRTDFSDDAAWDALVAKLKGLEGEFSADLEVVSDRTFEGVTPERFRSILPPQSDQSFGFLVDRTALVEPGNPILAVDLSKRTPKVFRVAAAAIGEVESNLSLANMDFKEFLRGLDADGVFRGSASAPD